MSFGLALRNSKNQIMFSTDFAAFHLAGKFTAIKSTSPYTPYNYEVFFTCVGRPIIFADGRDSNNNTTRTCTLQITDLGNNNWSAIILYIQTITLPTEIKVYVFSLASTPPTSGYGGFVKSSTGKTMLNLSQRVLKIAGAHKTAKIIGVSTFPEETLFSGTIPENYIVSCPPVGEALRSNGPSIPGGLFGLVPYRVAADTVGYKVGTPYGSSPAGVDAFALYTNQYILFAEKSLYE